jgi:hypothetical protein
MGRLIFLFLISFDFGLLLCKGDKRLAFMYALILTLSPIVQWWFAVNSIAELFILGQLGVLSVRRYIMTKSYKMRILYALIITWTSCAYIFTLYPAWQVPLAYIFGLIVIWQIIENWTHFEYTYKDVIILIFAVVSIASISIFFFYRSWDTVSILKNTIYPGHRFIQGGNESIKQFVKDAFNYLLGLILPFEDLKVTNNCEMARFFDFAPLGYLLVFHQWVKEKKIDLLNKMLLGLLAFFCVWLLSKWPHFLSQVSLLYSVLPNRMFLGTGFINVLVFFRVLATYKFEISKISSIVLASTFALALTIIAFKAYSLAPRYYYYIIGIVIFSIFYFVCRHNMKALCFMSLFLMIICGGFVNPIAKGADSIYKSKTYLNIRDIVQQDPDALWIVEDRIEFNDFPIMAGAKTINSVNAYPALSRWESLDPSGHYHDIYNRYAHINVRLVDSHDQIARFKLNKADFFNVELNEESLKKLHVKYVLAFRDLSHLKYSAINVKRKYQYNDQYIYELNY